MKSVGVRWKELCRFTPNQVLEWAADQDWATEMAECRQDPSWHREGNVWRHTEMVFGCLIDMHEFMELAPSDRLVLMLGALWHDLGKPKTTQMDPLDGRIRAPKHAPKGEQMARRLLFQLNSPVVERESICSLIRLHSAPVYVFENDQPDIRVAQLSWLSRNRDLFLLAKADQGGRISTKEKRDPGDLDLFAELARENKCYDSKYDYTNSQARFLAGRLELDYLNWKPHEDFRCQVTLMSGLPASGKDTWLRLHRPNLPVVSLDKIRQAIDHAPEKNQGEVVQMGKDACQQLLRSRTDFAFDATNTSRLLRRKWVELFASYGARVKIVYLEPPWDVLVKRNQNRNEPVPESIVKKLRDRLEPPHLLEAHEIEYVIES